MKELNIEAVRDNVDAVIDFIGEELEAHGCGFAEQMSINVAVDEIFANIAHYAYGGESGSAAVRVEVTDEPFEARITFIDEGVPFDPLSVPDPDTELSLDERDIGGMGIHIVRKSMDEVSYEYKDGRNIFTVMKKL